MLTKTLIFAALASSLALIPAKHATADAKDFIAGAVIGGVVGHAITKESHRKRQREVRHAPRSNSYAPAPRAHYAAPAPRARQVQRPSIPVTEEGRQIQTSLNYFGFDAGTVDGQIGGQTRNAVPSYQSYLGYEATGKLSQFKKDLLVSSYNRAQAGGDETFQRAAQLPDRTRGLLKAYRADIPAGRTQATFASGN